MDEVTPVTAQEPEAETETHPAAADATEHTHDTAHDESAVIAHAPTHDDSRTEDFPPFIDPYGDSWYNPPEKRLREAAFRKLALKIAASSIVVLFVAWLAWWLVNSVATVSNSQARLAETLSAQIKEASENAKNAKIDATHAVAAAERTQQNLEHATDDITQNLTLLSGRVDRTRADVARDIASIKSRLTAIEQHKSDSPRPVVSSVFRPGPIATPLQPPATHLSNKPIATDPHRHEPDSAAPVPAGTVVLSNQHWNLQNTLTHEDTEVIPFAHNVAGVMVHDLRDGKHYLVNMKGEWIGGAAE